MSLFPAYVPLQTEQAQPQQPANAASAQNATAWLENSSYAAHEIAKAHDAEILIESSDASGSSSDSSSASSSNSKRHGKKKKKQHKRLKKRKRDGKHDAPEPTAVAAGLALEFHNEEFYVDKKPARMYKTLRTLHRPACPRYRRSVYRKLGSASDIWHAATAATQATAKRYYRQKWQDSKMRVAPQPPLEENDYTLQMGQLNRRVMEAPAELPPWLELIHLQERNPYRWSRLLLAEKQLDYVQRALVYHPRSETLYRHYIDIVSVTYPAFEVSKLLDKLLAKDAHNYTLWTAQIMATQGSMARCVVPDVLRIYERCMQRMHHHSNKTIESNDELSAGNGTSTDDVMLKLFHNCALFLRQAGHYEQFFALVRLALELNVSTSQFGAFAPADADQRTLIEYEELVLQSGLPMNEIWLRIERLRQGYNFLPCPPNAAECADPQRIVFNEDVCHYIYPLKRRDNAFQLMLLVLRLLKLPFVQCDGLARRLGARVADMGDSDAIEDVLAVCVRSTYALPAAQQRQQQAFHASLLELAKELAVSPTFLSNSLGHEIYTRCVSELLLNCAATQASDDGGSGAGGGGGGDERQRIIFVLLWCRFQRLLLVLERRAGKLTADYVRDGRRRYKALLRQPANANVLHFYTELALYEYEALDDDAPIDAVRRIFDNMIAAHATNTANTDDEVQPELSSAADLCHMYVMYAELLIARGLHDDALQLIVAYALGGGGGGGVGVTASVGAAKKLAALQRLSTQLERLIAIERHVEVMVLEQYLLPDYTLTLLRMRTLLQCLIGQKLEALAALDKLLATFRRDDSARHAHLREHVHELYVMALQLPCASCAVSQAMLGARLFSALAEYPRNLRLLQRCTMLSATPWYRVRGALLRDNPSIGAVTFLIAAARYRFVQALVTTNSATSSAGVGGVGAADVPSLLAGDRRHSEAIVRNRLLNLFAMLTTATAGDGTGASATNRAALKALQRNALFWRFYLRCLSDQTTAFERSKQCLLAALDECPWAKALYVDGGMYVPQELAHLQDVIIEKQLRIYALPEELEILRER